MNNNYYISLCRGLIGYYVLAQAIDDMVVREYCTNYMGKMWCSVYEQKQFDKILTDFGGIVINKEKPIVLNDSPEYN
jgi:hypothetical protein